MNYSPSFVGKETQKARNNFPFRYPSVHTELFIGVIEVKKAAAIAHKQVGELPEDIADAIVEACDSLLADFPTDQFILPGLQGGAGTSINMNVNEVVAHRATELLAAKGNSSIVHPNDHVNRSQSTNDVNPSALKIACFRLTVDALNALNGLATAFELKASEWDAIPKLGRTHLQDAVPITVGSECGSYAATIRRGATRLQTQLPALLELNLGGTAVGNAINASAAYRNALYDALRAVLTFDQVRPLPNLMSGTSSQTDFVALSQALVAVTLDCSKIASDIRLMVSGPNGGFGELSIDELQSGSSIMPGKVNPVVPESVNQLYYLISGNNLTIEHAAHGSQFELGVMFPILAHTLITSLKMTTDVIENFTKQCVASMEVHELRCKELLERSSAYATLLTPKLGYDVVSRCVKTSIKSGVTLRSVIVGEGLITDEEFDALVTRTMV
jgi:aspartate ammonia-lyase